MGPVEITFLMLVLIFAVVGIVRGYHRELGVTTMLLLALFLIEFIEDKFGTQFTKVIAFVAGSDATQQKTVTALLWVAFLVVMAFISYQGQTLSFPGAGRGPLLGLLVGLLNGYLFAGSLWYYLERGGWPILHVTGSYTPLYNGLVRVLPPALLGWPYLIALVALMMILRVVK
jgi:uncharacterized membrane protein required for colicin V production